VRGELANGLTWRTAWDYQDYNKKSDPISLPERDFQGDSETLSLCQLSDSRE